MQSEPSEQKYKRVGLCGHKVDLLDHYGKRLDDLEQNVRLKQSEALLAEVCGAPFTIILLPLTFFNCQIYTLFNS